MLQADEIGTPARPTETLLRTRLAGILSRRPECSNVEGQEATIPVGAVGPVLDDYSAEYGITILTPDRRQLLAQVTEAIRDQPMNLEKLLTFIAEFTAASPSSSPGPEYGSPPDMQASMDEVVERGRQEDRDSHPQSRSSSNDSMVTSYYRPDGTRLSRPPSVPSTPGGSQTVSVPWTPSPFDSQHRQRAVPLQNAPPSAFHRKPAGPSRRRKSEGSASGMSDSEVRVLVVFSYSGLVFSTLNLGLTALQLSSNPVLVHADVLHQTPSHLPRLKPSRHYLFIRTRRTRLLSLVPHRVLLVNPRTIVSSFPQLGRGGTAPLSKWMLRLTILTMLVMTP